MTGEFHIRNKLNKLKMVKMLHVVFSTFDCRVVYLKPLWPNGLRVKGWVLCKSFHEAILEIGQKGQWGAKHENMANPLPMHLYTFIHPRDRKIHWQNWLQISTACLACPAGWTISDRDGSKVLQVADKLKLTLTDIIARASARPKSDAQLFGKRPFATNSFIEFHGYKAISQNLGILGTSK